MSDFLCLAFTSSLVLCIALILYIKYILKHCEDYRYFSDIDYEIYNKIKKHKIKKGKINEKVKITHSKI